MKSLWLKILETSGAKIYGLLIGIIFLFLTAHLLGPEGRGIIASVTAWVGLFAVFSGLSLGQVALYRIQEKRRQQWLPDALGTLAFLSTILSLFGCLVAYIVYQASDGHAFRNIPVPVLILGFIMLPFIMWEEYGSFLLSAADSLRAYNIAQIIGKTAGICAIVLLSLWGKLDVIGAILSVTGGQIILCLICVWALWKLADHTMHVDRGMLKSFLDGAAKLHVNTIAAFLLGQVNILMLNHYRTNAEVGWYQLSFQMITIMLVVPQAASLVLYSKMAEVGPDNLWPKQKKLILHIVSAMILLSCVAYIIVPAIITLLAGTAFEPSIKVFRLLLPAMLGMTIATLLANQWIGRGIFLTTTMMTFATAVLNIVINFYAIPKYGMMGAVWSMILSYAVFANVAQLCFAFYCEGKYRKLPNSTI
jgi:O-antigen/teichoic acid export membrane protein